MRRLILWFLVAVTAFAFLSTYSSRGIDPVDPWIVGGIGLTFTCASVVMLLFTRRWTTRGIGVLFTFTGCAVLYGGSWIFYRYPELAPAASEPASDATRSFLAVGGPLVMFGLVLVIADWWRCRKDPACDESETQDW